jgi:hypothetical protein
MGFIGSMGFSGASVFFCFSGKSIFLKSSFFCRSASFSSVVEMIGGDV